MDLGPTESGAAREIGRGAGARSALPRRRLEDGREGGGAATGDAGWVVEGPVEDGRSRVHDVISECRAIRFNVAPHPVNGAAGADAVPVVAEPVGVIAIVVDAEAGVLGGEGARADDQEHVEAQGVVVAEAATGGIKIDPRSAQGGGLVFVDGHFQTEGVRAVGRRRDAIGAIIIDPIGGVIVYAIAGGELQRVIAGGVYVKLIIEEDGGRRQFIVTDCASGRGAVSADVIAGASRDGDGKGFRAFQEGIVNRIDPEVHVHVARVHRHRRDSDVIHVAAGDAGVVEVDGKASGVGIAAASNAEGAIVVGILLEHRALSDRDVSGGRLIIHNGNRGGVERSIRRVRRRADDGQRCRLGQFGNSVVHGS